MKLGNKKYMKNGSIFAGSSAAVQRMSELTGDESREKEMLDWIRENMFGVQGLYHSYLNSLAPGVRDHFEDRLKNG